MSQCHVCGQRIYYADCAESGAGWKMECGDSIKLMRAVAPESVDAVITDPPYGSGGDTLSSRIRTSKSKYVSSDASYQSTLPDIAGDSLLPEAWQEDLRQWMKLSYGCIKPGGVLLTFIDWRNLSSIHTAAMRAGFRPRGVVVWNKGRGSRPNKNGFRLQSEFIYWASKGAIKRQQDPVYKDGVLSYSKISNGKVHITQKPTALMRELVDVVPRGGVILDPFAGSGTTGVAAIESGRQFIGYELVPEYYETAAARLREAESHATP